MLLNTRAIIYQGTHSEKKSSHKMSYFFYNSAKDDKWVKIAIKYNLEGKGLNNLTSFVRINPLSYDDKWVLRSLIHLQNIHHLLHLLSNMIEYSAKRRSFITLHHDWQPTIR